MKACSSDIAQKTEKGLIRVDFRTDEKATTAFEEIMANMTGNENTVLVQEMVKV